MPEARRGLVGFTRALAPKGPRVFAAEGSFGSAAKGSFGSAAEGSFVFAPEGSFVFAPERSFVFAPEGLLIVARHFSAGKGDFKRDASRRDAGKAWRQTKYRVSFEVESPDA